ncbi:MAG: hypothetical protein ACFFDQ_13375, partial [Candidatus Thorarchaeota archaeon]
MRNTKTRKYLNIRFGFPAVLTANISATYWNSPDDATTETMIIMDATKRIGMYNYGDRVDLPFTEHDKDRPWVERGVWPAHWLVWG